MYLIFYRLVNVILFSPILGIPLPILARQQIFKFFLLEVRGADRKHQNSVNHGEDPPYFWPHDNALQESLVLAPILGVGSSLRICTVR